MCFLTPRILWKRTQNGALQLPHQVVVSVRTIDVIILSLIELNPSTDFFKYTCFNVLHSIDVKYRLVSVRLVRIVYQLDYGNDNVCHS